MHGVLRMHRRKYLEAAFFQNSLSISILYSHNALWSMFLWRLRSIRLQKNGFLWACSGIFSKHIAPKSPAGEANRRDQPEKPPQRKTSHSVKSFKTLQQAAKLCRRQDGSRLQISCNVGNQLQRRSCAAGGPYHPREPLLACEGCLWLQAAESAELHIRLTEVSGTGVGIYELRHLWACAAGSSAKGSPRARQTRELRPEILQRAGANRGGVGLPAV